jgi:hypothetical protein
MHARAALLCRLECWKKQERGPQQARAFPGVPAPRLQRLNAPAQVFKTCVCARIPAFWFYVGLSIDK